MNDKPGRPPPVTRELPTNVERWYYDALVLWTQRMKRAPKTHELAHWLKRSTTATYSALRSLEYKGWLTRAGTTSKRVDRMFTPVQQ